VDEGNPTSKAIRTLALRRRLLLAGIVTLLVLTAAIPLAKLISPGGWTVLKIAFFSLTIFLTAQVAFGFAGAAMGWWVLRFRSETVRISGLARASESLKKFPAVAIVMPVYNEDSARIFQGLRIMYESLEKTGLGAEFDFFVLSDSSDPNCWVAEESAWFELCKKVGGFGRIFYRKRRVQLHNKSGNIADFCRRWGASYRYMIVLDADSIMTGPSFIELTRLMELNPQVGIIQTNPRPILGLSLFQRLDQFAANVYRPIFTAGANFWQLSDATFWGHNAIVRLKPFMRYCAMPELPEVGPLGKRVLSHDTIEAALIRRGGYEVWLAYNLEGSYEEGPPHLLAGLQRDRRWCHGNLQHIWFLFERGLRTVSRFNIFHGILAYGSSPLWLLSLVLGGLLASQPESGPSAGVGNSYPLVLSGLLYFYIMVLLLLPKALSAALLMRSEEQVKHCGGQLKVVFSVLAETLHSMLMAPILMLFYTRFVLASFSGFVVRWTVQTRAGSEPSWGAWMITHAGNSMFALLAGALVMRFAPALIPWLALILIGPLVAVPLSKLTASKRLGQAAKAKGWFLIPEETAPPPELAAMEEPFTPAPNPLFMTKDYASDYGLLQAVLDPYINAIHVSLLRQRTENSPRNKENLALLADRLLLDGPFALTSIEKRTLLWDAETMLGMHQKLWSSPASHLHDWWQAAFRHYVEHTALTVRRTANF